MECSSAIAFEIGPDIENEVPWLGFQNLALFLRNRKDPSQSFAPLRTGQINDFGFPTEQLHGFNYLREQL